MTPHELSDDVSEKNVRKKGISSIAKPIVWMFLGGLIVVATAFLTGVYPPQGAGQETASADARGDVQLWTCGMHPEVIQEEPGICPICHMDLTPLRTGSASSQGTAHEGHGDATEQLWTCPMHPSILEPEPGSCPICGMDLVPVKDHLESEAEAADHGDHPQGTTVTIDPVVVQNMNVRTEPVQRRDLSRAIRTVGHLDYDQERMVSVTTRYEGFIEKVFVNYGSSHAHE